MSWYEITITPAKQVDYVRGGRLLVVWDERPKAKIIDYLKVNGSVTLWRGAFSQDKMRVEDRGTIAVMDGHIISIEDRPDMDDRYPGGPTERKGR